MVKEIHQDGTIRAAIKYARKRGFTAEKHRGHTVVVLKCSPGCCIINVYGTPKNAETHAKQIRAKVDKCDGGKKK